MLIPPDPDVPDFVLRDVSHQYMRDWTQEERERFAPLIKKETKRPEQGKKKNSGTKMNQNLDDLLG
jgi:hypothetical protein